MFSVPRSVKDYFRGGLQSEAWASLRKWFLGWLDLGPHFLVGGPDYPYLRRWYLLPRNPWVNVYLHQFVRDDDDRALHDHPWASASLTLRRGYWEETRSSGRTHWAFHRPGGLVFRPAAFAHRVELLRKGAGGKHAPRLPAWTLFVTGPRVREWGFHCPQGWVPWQRFVVPTDQGNVTGGGCGEVPAA